MLTLVADHQAWWRPPACVVVAIEAQRYLEQAVTLAGLSGDGQVQHQTWRYAAMLAG
ncbi:hypothetical protein [Streptomyces sp. NPDC049949]|uniref:hypothetical protein n=1 Tax=Streptomyces sp. NPDC049949 TaxID=3154627 RepID=UPI003446FBCC